MNRITININGNNIKCQGNRCIIEQFGCEQIIDKLMSHIETKDLIIRNQSDIICRYKSRHLLNCIPNYTHAKT